jgi:hypothetical protein
MHRRKEMHQHEHAKKQAHPIRPVGLIRRLRLGDTPQTVEQIEAEAMDNECPSMPHYHKNEDGVIVQCYHKCAKGVRTTLGSPAFWIGVTLTYPIEHLLWEKVWGFRHIAEWLGMH